MAEYEVTREELQEDLTDRVTYIMGYIECNMGSYESGLTEEETDHVVSLLQELLAVIDTDC